MQISLTNILPLPLRERLAGRSSDVWNNKLILEHQQWVKIIAPSGTGKTTLVHLMYGLRQDYDGEIAINGAPLRGTSAETLADMRKRSISIIFQDLRLFPQLTCRENIELKRVMQPPYCDASAIETMAATLGVTHILDQQVGICSYGEQQRVAIIRALMQPFAWLIMDEPFSHLDQANARKAAELIADECRKRGAGLLITDLDEDEYFPYHRQLLL